MNVLYFTFADNPAEPVSEIRREGTRILRCLEPLVASGHFQLVMILPLYPRYTSENKLYRQRCGFFPLQRVCVRQVTSLHGLGIPVVIATCRPIGDEKATAFSFRL